MPRHSFQCNYSSISSSFDELSTISQSMSPLDVEASEESSWSPSHSWSDIPISVGDDLPAQPTISVWPDRAPIGYPSFAGRKTEPNPRSSVRSDRAPRASLVGEGILFCSVGAGSTPASGFHFLSITFLSRDEDIDDANSEQPLSD